MENKMVSDKIYIGFHINHDFLFFSSRDYDTYSVMERIISNFSLNYALNVNIGEIHRICSGTKPSYFEDFKEIEIYSTPGYFWEDFKENIRKLNGKKKKYNSLFKNILSNYPFSEYFLFSPPKDKVQFQYNSIGEELTFLMTPARYNFPNLGSYEKIPPLQLFITFIFGNKPPMFYRLGKKEIAVRLECKLITEIIRKEGIFYPSHPVNLRESLNNYEILDGTVWNLKPVPLLTNCKLKGKYLELKLSNLKLNVIPPNKSIYHNI